MNPTNPTIRIQGEHFVLSFPPATKGSREHEVRIPLRDPDKLVAVLMARQRGALRIAEPGSPTQWNIDRERACIETFCADKRANLLAELGL